MRHITLDFILTVYFVSAPALSGIITNQTQTNSVCQLPPYPLNGRYEVVGDIAAGPGKLFQRAVSVSVYCDEGYDLDGNNQHILICSDLFSVDLPNCIRHCAVIPDRSVEYKCRTSENEPIRPCYSLEVVGATVVPTCKTSYYGSPSEMHCTEQGWDHIATCSSNSATGTNITIFAKDNIELYISTFKYNNKPQLSEVLPNIAEPKKTDVNTNNIDKTFWRFGDDDTGDNTNYTVKENIMDNRNTLANVNINIEDGKVQIRTGDIVVNLGY